MKMYALQGIQIEAPAEAVFGYVADASNLPEWTKAFASVDGAKAVMRTPNGELPVDLLTQAHEQPGTVDFQMTFPDGSSSWAYSRVVPLDERRCLYGFVLTAPPVPLKKLEGALDEQKRTLAEELETLKTILEHA